MSRWVFWSVLPFLATVQSGIVAQPDFGSLRRVGDMTVYQDVHDRATFYYVPGPIRMAVKNGVPMFDFIQIRYTGTAARGDQGTFRLFSQVTLTLETDDYAASVLDNTAASLAGPAGADVHLRPIPIGRLEGDLVYALPGTDSLSSVGRDSVAIDRSRARWFDQTFTIRLDDAASMALWETLQQGSAIMSFAYAYVADVVEQSVADVGVAGTGLSTSGLADTLGIETEAPSSVEKVVFADAFSIELDPSQYPDHFTRVDLNGDRVPPGYAALTVRCYDFRNEERDDLWEKLVEIEAESVSGRPSRISFSFSIDEPNVYKYAARFPYAVRLDRPFRYRVTQIDVEGGEVVGDWIERDSWVEPLDISTPYDQLLELREARQSMNSEADESLD